MPLSACCKTPAIQSNEEKNCFGVMPFLYIFLLLHYRLYWSDWNMLSIVSVTKSVGRNRSLVEDSVAAQQLQLTQNATDVITDLFFPTDLHVVHPVLQPPMENPCERGVANGGCEYLCLLSAEAEEGFTCRCQTGIELTEDGKGCRSKQIKLSTVHGNAVW